MKIRKSTRETSEDILLFDSIAIIQIFDCHPKNYYYLCVKHQSIVFTPIADDTVGVQIRRFIMGYLSASALVEELRFKGDHAIQYFFGTPKAVELLKRIKL